MQKTDGMQVTYIGENTRNTSRGTGVHQEKTKVANGVFLGVRRDEQTGDTYKILCTKPECSLSSFIRDVGKDIGAYRLQREINTRKGLSTF